MAGSDESLGADDAPAVWLARAPDITNLASAGCGFIGPVELTVGDVALTITGHRSRRYVDSMKWGIVGLLGAGLALGLLVLGVRSPARLADALLYVAALLFFMVAPAFVASQILKASVVRHAPVESVSVPVSEVHLGSIPVGYHPALPDGAQPAYKALAAKLSALATGREVLLSAAALGVDRPAGIRLVFCSKAGAAGFAAAVRDIAMQS